MNDQEDASKQRGIAELDADEDVTLVDAEEDMNADVQGRLAEFQAKKIEEEVTVPDEGSKRKGKHLEHDTTKKQTIDEEAEELKTHL
nr:hypothetical protein [Tanacetum cinerariifolium]